MIKDKKNLNVPPLRFPGFEGEWAKFNASDILKSFTTNSLPWDKLTFDGGKIKNFHYGLIHKGLQILAKTSDKRIPFLINSEYKNNKELIQKGDFIFADASEDYNGIAKAIEIIWDDIPSIAVLHTIHSRQNNDLMTIGFGGYLFNSSRVLETSKMW